MGALPLRQFAQSRQVGVIAALTVEARTLARRRVAPGDSLTIRSGAQLAVCGSGAHLARASAEALIRQGASLLISWGTAGGLARQLPPGTLLLPLQVLDSEGETHPVATDVHRHVHQHLQQCAQVRHDPVVESHRIIDCPHDKARLHRQSGASAVDMESAAIARVARAAGIPFVAIRTVLDRVDTPVPEAARLAVDERGRLQWRRLCHSLAGDPRQLAALMQLAWDLRRAQQTLNRAGRALGLR